jgi:hypothetical protein
MSHTKRKNNPTVTPLPIEKLQEEINGGKNKLPPNPVKPVKQQSNPYRIVGTARPSKTGQSLSIKIGNIENIRYFTLLKEDIVRMFTDANDLTVAYVREYDNPQTSGKPVIIRTNFDK